MCGAAGLFAVAAIASSAYPGSGATFVFFNLCFAALLALAAPRPRLYVYTFLAAFFALGFWLKVLFHSLAAPGFVEPIGDFPHTAAAWDRGLLAIAFGALGLIAARLLHLWCTRNPAAEAAARVPSWYRRWERPIWVATVLLIVLVNAANLHFAFYQIGVRPKLLLPLRAHVLIGWLVNIGFALWVAVLLWWRHRSARLSGTALVLPLAEALCAAISAFSRLLFIVRAAAYLLAFFERRRELAPAIGRRPLYWLAGALVALFAASVIVVFALRVYHYYGYATDTAGAEPFAHHVERTIYKQVPLLLVHRWVGLEGVLAVGAAEQSSQRLVEALTESPKLAGESLFQRVARPAYLSEQPEQFVFLANAGPVAVLWFSGSLAVVFAGMALIGLFMLATEEAARRSLGNPFLLAVAGAGLASVVSQTTFFYLTAIFLLQLWIALAFVLALERS